VESCNLGTFVRLTSYMLTVSNMRDDYDDDEYDADWMDAVKTERLSYHASWMDAVVTEILSSSPLVVNPYANCGLSQASTRARN